MASQNLAIKVTLEDEVQGPCTRKFYRPRHSPPSTIQELDGIARERFGLEPNTVLRWQYRDDEGDDVTISSKAELDEFFANLPASTTILRFSITVDRSATHANDVALTALAVREYHNLSGDASSSTSFAVRHDTPSEFGGLSVYSEGGNESVFNALAIDSGLVDDSKRTEASEPVVDDLMAWSTVEFEECSNSDSTDTGSDSDEDSVVSISSSKPAALVTVGDQSSSTVTPLIDTAAFRSDRDSWVTPQEPLLTSEDVPAPHVDARNDERSASETTVESRSEPVAEDPIEEPLVDLSTEDPADTPLPSPISANADADAGDQPPLPALPPALAAFLSTIPGHADRLTSQLTSIFDEPRLATLFSARTTPLENIPTLVRAVTSDVTNAVGELFQGFRREADSLRAEFDTFRSDIQKERVELQEAFNNLRTSDTSASTMTPASEPERETANLVGEVKGKKELSDDEFLAALAAVDEDIECSRNEWAGRSSLEEATEAEKKERLRKMKRIYEKERLELKEARRLAKAEKLASKEVKRAEKRAEKRAASFKSIVTDTVAPSLEPAVENDTPQCSPFDDVYATQEEPQSGRSRKHRDHHHAHGLGLRDMRRPARTSRSSPPSLDDLALPAQSTHAVPPQHEVSVVPSDDFFRRRIGSGGFIPGAYYRPAAAVTSFSTSFVAPQDPVPSDAPVPDPAPTEAAPLVKPVLQMPGAFVDSHTPSPLPVASTSYNPIQAPWAEVTPAQLSRAIKELGFDVKEVGIKIAVERSWEEQRGKSLADMVGAVLEKVLA